MPTGTTGRPAVDRGHVKDVAGQGEDDRMSLRGDGAGAAPSGADAHEPRADGPARGGSSSPSTARPFPVDAIELAVEMAAKHRSALTFVHVVPRLDVVPAGAVDGIGTAVPHQPAEHDHVLLADASAVAF